MNKIGAVIHTALFYETKIISLAALLILIVSVSMPLPAKAQEASQRMQQLPVVRAVMFWMDGCPHCHQVLDNVLPPLQEKYGDQFQLQLVELVTVEDTDRLYQTAAVYNIPKEQVGVPILIIGNRILIGSEQITAELPELIEKYIVLGGQDFPNLPGWDGIIPASVAEKDSEIPTVVAAAEKGSPSPSSRAVPRSNGFSLAISLIVGMIASLIYTGIRFIQGSPGKKAAYMRSLWYEFTTPILAVLGLGVAGYLAYVETQAVPAVCGPVGDCNTVQSSTYARLFGVLPIGILGAIGYLSILIAWAWKWFRSDWISGHASLAILAMTFFGVLFSLYLTYLEPFVIKAVCAWCLTSAVLITLLLLVNVNPALQELEGTSEE